MTIPDAYSNWSATYDSDRNLTRDLDQEVTRAALEPGSYRSILEIGCGTGKNTALFTQIGKRVCALDLSVGMINKAKEKLPFANVNFSVADLTRPWPCRAESSDLVVCNLVLEHIRNLDFIFSEAHRVLILGGRFFVSELHPFRQYQGAQANFQREAGTIQIQAFMHHLSEFTGAAETNGLALKSFKEWWHAEDQGQPPRLASFVFEK